MLTSHGLKTFACKQCTFVTHSYTSLWNHVLEIHGDINEYSNNLIVGMFAMFQKTISESMDAFQQMMITKIDKISQKQEKIDEQFINQSNAKRLQQVQQQQLHHTK